MERHTGIVKQEEKEMALYSGKRTVMGKGDAGGRPQEPVSPTAKTPRSQLENPAVGKDLGNGTEPCKGKLG